MKLATVILTVITPLLAQQASCPGTVKHIRHYAIAPLMELICDNAVDNGCPKELPPPAETCKLTGTSEYKGTLTYNYDCFRSGNGSKFFDDLKSKDWNCKRIRIN